MGRWISTPPPDRETGRFFDSADRLLPAQSPPLLKAEPVVPTGKGADGAKRYRWNHKQANVQYYLRPLSAFFRTDFHSSTMMRVLVQRIVPSALT
jgi:hypothetical protein